MAGQTRQQLNDPQVARLSGEFFQRAGDVATIAGTDAKPNNDGFGIAARWINPQGLVNWSAHFRPLETTGPGNGTLLNYAWQGAPLSGAPASVFYSWSNDYLRVNGNAAASVHFLSRAIPAVAGNWQNQAFSSRCSGANTTDVGIRIDDGSNLNYVEYYLDGQANGTAILTFNYVDAGGAAAFVGPTIAMTQPLILRLYCNWTGAAYVVYGYLIDESGASHNMTDFSRNITANWTVGPPIAGRVGVLVKNTGTHVLTDWFWNTFA